MDTKKTLTQKKVIWGIMGIILGTLITGIFSLIIQRQNFKMNQSLFYSQRMINEKELFIDQLFEYCDLIQYYREIKLTDNTLNKNDMALYGSKLLNETLKLTLVSNPEVGMFTIFLNSEMIRDLRLDKASFESDISIDLNYNEAYQNWLIAVYKYLNKLNVLSIPEKDIDISIMKFLELQERDSLNYINY